MFRQFQDDDFFSDFPSSFMSMPNFGRQLEGRDDKNNRNLSTRDPFQQMMGNMSKAMEDMRSFSTMDHIAEGNPNTYSFSSSSVMSYQNDGKSKPKIYQATSSTRRAPGDVKETRRTLRDSAAGLDKMAIGQHIGRREKVMQKQRRNGGPIEEEKWFVEMNEDDEPQFDQEWKKHAQSFRIFPAEKDARARNQGRNVLGQNGTKPNHRHLKQPREETSGRNLSRLQGPSKSGRQRRAM